jgi:hypothetical protein
MDQNPALTAIDLNQVLVLGWAASLKGALEKQLARLTRCVDI